MAATASNFEKNTATIPGTENAVPHSEPDRENAYQRVTEYPVVKDSLSQAHNLISSNQYSEAIYNKATQISLQVLEKLEPLQKRLPLETVDSYANAGLDFLEKKVPAVKTPSAELFQTARKPADEAAGLAKSYADGIQSRFSPVTDQISARIAQGQETIHALQERLHSTVSALPHDSQSATEAIKSLRKEVESLSAYLTQNISSLPQQAQHRAQPLIDTLQETTQHIKQELTKPDTPIGTRAANVVSYSQSQISPLLNAVKEVLIGVKHDAESQAGQASEKVEQVSQDTQEKGQELAEDAQKKTQQAKKSAQGKADKALKQTKETVNGNK